jgi:SprA-related family
MSLAIAPTFSAPLAACACGTCAACSPRRVAEATPAPVAEVAGSRPRTDSFVASGAAPKDEPQVAVLGNAPDDAAVAGSAEGKSAEAISTEDQAEGKSETNSPAAKGQELTPDERQMVAELQLRDREVRAHEAAHKAAGGAAVGGASYTYQQGPDGRQYAIGGEVPVDLSTGGGSPEAVIAKMEQVRAAALAPGDPSSQDHAVAAAADAIAAQARRDLQKAESETAKADEQPTAESSAPADDAASGSDDLVGVGAAESRQINGRALDAYRRAQDGWFAQGLIDQRA